MPKEKLRLNPETGEFEPVLNADGQELPDPTPIAPPIGYKREPPLHERITAMVRAAHQDLRDAERWETPEEAEDFFIPDEDDPREGRFALLPGFEWEENYNPPEDFKEMHKRLTDLGWTPPPARSDEGQVPSSAPSNSGSPNQKGLDARPAAENRSEAAPAASGSKS